VTDGGEPVACAVCGLNDARVLSGRARWGQRVRTVVCRRCGLVYASPRPERERLARFYRERIYPQYIDASGRFRERLLAASRVQARDTFEYFASRAGQRLVGARVLEVGCGLGDFLVLARQAGARVHGLELEGPYADFAEKHHDLSITRGRVEDVDTQVGFDVIALFHVVEHLEDPVGVLAALRTRLATGGRLFIEVPDFMGPWRIPFTEFLRLEHLYNFSPPTLRAVLAGAGFRVTSQDDDPFLLRVVAEPVSGELPAPAPEQHRAHVLRHVLTWRVRGRLLQPYYAARRLLSRASAESQP
jgi:2-polyprenyl-3-methyl-5-hydroxy-6-metoxy-1,4-benzoquinol methylase